MPERATTFPGRAGHLVGDRRLSGGALLVAVFVGCAGSGREPEPKKRPAAPETVSSLAKRPARPTADALFERALEASGGRARLLSLSGFRAKGQIEASDGVSAALVVWARAPDLVRTRVTLAPGIVLEEGFDGEVSWSKDPFTGPRISPLPLARARRQSDLHAPANYARHFPKRRTVGRATFDGRPAWQVEVTTPDGRTEQHYFDPESGRALGFEGKALTAEGEVKAGAVYLDWMTVEGLELPSKVKSHGSAVEQVQTIEAFVLEVPPASRFEPPGEVEALRARREK